MSGGLDSPKIAICSAATSRRMGGNEQGTEYASGPKNQTQTLQEVLCSLTDWRAVGDVCESHCE